MKRTRINPVSTKRKAERITEDAIKKEIFFKGDTFCEYCLKNPIYDRGHEIVFRGRGGSCTDPFNIIQLCLYHHNQQHGLYKDNPPIPVDELLAIVKEIRLKQGFSQ